MIYYGGLYVELNDMDTHRLRSASALPFPYKTIGTRYTLAGEILESIA